MTGILGHSLRVFLREVCANYDTRELPHEETARVGRRVISTAARARADARSVAPTLSPVTSTGPKQRKLNLSTYKLHALGDYPSTIRHFGTTDSYNTQLVCSLTLTCTALTTFSRENLSTGYRNVGMNEQTSIILSSNLQNMKPESDSSRSLTWSSLDSANCTRLGRASAKGLSADLSYPM